MRVFQADNARCYFADDPRPWAGFRAVSALFKCQRWPHERAAAGTSLCVDEPSRGRKPTARSGRQSIVAAWRGRIGGPGGVRIFKICRNDFFIFSFFEIFKTCLLYTSDAADE